MPSAGGQSVVALRNDASAAVEVTLSGAGERKARIAAGSTMPLRLPPGTYELHASGGGATSARSTLALAANRTYSLLVSRSREGGKDVLVLIEPLEPAD